MKKSGVSFKQTPDYKKEDNTTDNLQKGRRIQMGQHSMDNSLPIGFLLKSNRTNLHYKITTVLGSGGYGITYKAINLEKNYVVAIKELFPSGVVYRASDYTVCALADQKRFSDGLHSFMKEIQILFNLNGLESAVRIYDFFYDNNTAYYVMEYISGDNLLDYIKKTGLIKPADWQLQIRQLMQDIELLHKHGVIHRDISPDNIKLTEENKFKLIDFGAARLFTSGQNLTVNLKQDFAPIEQYSSTGQGTYTDVYTLAATLYYCFTGKLIPRALLRQQKDELIPPSKLGVKLNLQQEQALLKALAVNPHDRFQTMKQFEDAFFARQDNQAIVSGPGMERRFQNSVSILKDNLTFTAASLSLALLALIFQLVL